MSLPSVLSAEIVDARAGRRVRVTFGSGYTLLLTLEEAALAASDPQAALRLLRRAAQPKGAR